MPETGSSMPELARALMTSEGINLIKALENYIMGINNVPLILMEIIWGLIPINPY